MGERVVVTGAVGPLGERVEALASADPSVASVTVVELDLLSPVVISALEGADVLIHLGPGSGPDLDGTGGSDVSPSRWRRLAREASAAGVSHLVVVSTAMVYGAWSNNPVPITEDAVLRPSPAVDYAVTEAEIERQAVEWRDAHPGATVAVLRPTVTVAPERPSWLIESPWSARGGVPAVGEAASQFLHVDDLAAAVDHARRRRLDGPFNVAPDGWLAAELVRELGSPTSRVPLPGSVVRFWARLRHWTGRTAIPVELLAYREHPWVVANDRLRATGWAPRYSNEEVYVEGSPAGPLQGMSPRHRQELSLAVAGAVVTAVVVGAVVLVRRRSRRSVS